MRALGNRTVRSSSAEFLVDLQGSYSEKGILRPQVLPNWGQETCTGVFQ